MAGRHGVPTTQRKDHSREMSGRRRRRVQEGDAAQPWRLWLTARGVLVLVVVAAMVYSVLLLRTGRTRTWPVIALAAGSLSLLMIALDVRARVRLRGRQRTAARADQAMEATALVHRPAASAPPPETRPGPPAEQPAPATRMARRAQRR